MLRLSALAKCYHRAMSRGRESESETLKKNLDALKENNELKIDEKVESIQQ